jgi:CRISPR-associated protein Csm3
MENTFQLYGRIFIKSRIVAVTGLHIGGSSVGMEIGGVDKAVIRDPITGCPYIPGSSLRGKMRSQTEKVLGLPQNNSIGQVKIHTCKKSEEYDKNGGCPVCHVFGVPAEVEANGPTLLVVRDTPLDIESEDGKKIWNGAKTDLPYSEIKTEVAIDRVTSAASPRQIERVPAGAIFSPAEFVFSVYEEADFTRFKTVTDAMQLVEDDYIGGSGSRGSGKIHFSNIEIFARHSKDYAKPVTYKTYQNLQELEDDFSNLINWAKSTIKVG